MHRRILTGLTLMLAGTVNATEVTGGLIGNPQTQTERWLQWQTEGSAASTQVQSATPAERELSMQRLLDSFNHPIPEYFGEKDGGSFER